MQRLAWLCCGFGCKELQLVGGLAHAFLQMLLPFQQRSQMRKLIELLEQWSQVGRCQLQLLCQLQAAALDVQSQCGGCQIQGAGDALCCDAPCLQQQSRGCNSDGLWVNIDAMQVVLENMGGDRGICPALAITAVLGLFAVQLQQQIEGEHQKMTGSTGWVQQLELTDAGWCAGLIQSGHRARHIVQPMLLQFAIGLQLLCAGLIAPALASGCAALPRHRARRALSPCCPSVVGTDGQPAMPQAVLKQPFDHSAR